MYQVEFYNLNNGQKYVEKYTTADEANGEVTFANREAAKTHVKARFLGKTKGTTARVNKRDLYH